MGWRAVACAVTLTASTGMACPYDPDAQYDQIGQDGVSIATAKVTLIDWEARAGLGSCVSVSYDVVEVLAGQPSSTFVIRNCLEDIWDETDQQQAEGLEFVGLFLDAEVIVGLVEQEGKDPRYAVPGCWGPMVYNLAQLEDRESLLNEFRVER